MSSPLTVEPGRLWAGLNYVPVEAGYRRISGFERHDGRPSPTDAAYWLLGYELGTGESVADVGDTLTGENSSATCKVLKVIEGEDDAGEYVVGRVSGTFEDAEALQLSGTDHGDAVGTTRQYGAGTVDDDLDFRDLAAEDRRADIEKVPGVGPVRGVHWYKGELYAVRDDDSADPPTAARMYRATSSGWTQVTGVTLSDGGTYRFINFNFQGQPATQKMYGVNGQDKAFHLHKSDADTPVFTFTSITTGTTPDDIPTHVAVQANRLVLVIGGSLIISETGDPDGYDASTGDAAEIATGQVINGILGGLGLGNLLVMGDDHMAVLYGSDDTDFAYRPMSQEQTGGVEGTLQSVGGPLYMDNRGVRSVTTTEAYGNFVIGTMTADVQPWLDRQRDERNLPAGSLRIRSADQYRVFLTSGLGLCIYLGRGRPEMSFIDYGKSIECSVSAEDDDRIERVFFGSDDGFVYEAERGRSFDGEPIAAYIRLPLNHAGSPTRSKKWIRADAHLDVQSQIKMELSALYDDGANPDQLTATQTVRGGGTLFEEGLYDEGYYDAPLNSFVSYDLEGIGRNVSLLLRTESDREPTHTLNGISLHSSLRKVRR